VSRLTVHPRPEYPAPLTCCGGIYAHRQTCPHHRHTFDGPRSCGGCAMTPRPIVDVTAATFPTDSAAWLAAARVAANGGPVDAEVRRVAGQWTLSVAPADVPVVRAILARFERAS
jgi:hypothetical protein